MRDSDSNPIKTKTGIDIFYNVQIFMDCKHHLIVDYDVGNNSTGCSSISKNRKKIV
jgi:hypothetical protein